MRHAQLDWASQNLMSLAFDAVQRNVFSQWSDWVYERRTAHFSISFQVGFLPYIKIPVR